MLGSNAAQSPASCSWPPVQTEKLERSGLWFHVPRNEMAGTPSGHEWSGPGEL